MKKVMVWFRNDLRIRDNETLLKACINGNQVIPFYVLDERLFLTTKLGFPRAGGLRLRFLLESLSDLKTNLQAFGADLIIRKGSPANIIPALAKELNVDVIHYSKEVAYEERMDIEEVERRLLVQGVALNGFWQSTLFHEDDVPWPVKQVPDVFTRFRKESEKTVEVHPAYEVPQSINFNKEIDPGRIPSLDELAVAPEERSTKAVLDFKGGETPAWDRLNDYFWKDDLLKKYKYTRNELIGKDFSSKFSPWLALGCISARSIYFEIKRYEQERTKNSSTYWLFFELLWRDFFKFMTKKHGKSIFLKSGITVEEMEMKNDYEVFNSWRNGTAGEPFVDANMIELKETGYMSNRGRQNVASYLIHDLGVNWTWGAMWFENRLIDYDPSSNWLNWAYIAGVGNDPQKGRKFSIENQSMRYDPKGEYVQLWLKDIHYSSLVNR
ncbi:MAG: DASH family cryptochrome [Bacteroidota bacterium]